MAEVELVEKKGTTSYVWTFFGLKKDHSQDSEQVIYRLCRNSVIARGGNTSNLFSHLQNHHPKEHTDASKAKTLKGKRKMNDDDQSKQITLQESAERTKPLPKTSRRWQDITNSVTRFIAKEMMPIRTVERPGFREMLLKLEPRYEVPSRKYFSKTAIPSLYTTTRDNIAASLRNMQYYSITTDMWSATGTMTSYMAVTVHYIDSEWILQSHCLQTVFVPEDHTAENLATALQEALESWALPENHLACVTTDNGSNIVAAIRSLKWNRLSCFGHNLHLAITNSLRDDDRVTRAVGIAHKIVNAFSHSWKKRRDLVKAQMEFSLPTHSLITVCSLLNSHYNYAFTLLY